MSAPDKAADERAPPTLSADALELAGKIESRLGNVEIPALALDDLQKLMAALCKAYAHAVELGEVEPPVASRTGISSTAAMIVAAGLLKASGMSAFELGFWQSWTGR